MFSIFSKPEIKQYLEDKSAMTLVAYLKSKTCGKIVITPRHITILISGGINFFKGALETRNVNLNYLNGELVIGGVSGKKIYSIKCPEEIFIKARSFFQTITAVQ